MPFPHERTRVEKIHEIFDFNLKPLQLAWNNFPSVMAKDNLLMAIFPWNTTGRVMLITYHSDLIIRARLPFIKRVVLCDLS